MKLNPAFRRSIILQFCILSCFCLRLAAQDPYADSLKTEISTAKHDTSRCMALNELAEYIYNQYPDSALALWQQVVTVADKGTAKTTDKRSSYLYSFLTARSYMNHGTYYLATTGPDEALKYFQKSLSISKQIGEQEGVANCLQFIGSSYLRKGDVLQALDHYHKGLKIYEKLNVPSNMAFCLANIGTLYSELGELENALDYLNRSAKIYEEQKNKQGLAYSLSGIAYLYNEKGDPECKESPAICISKGKEKALNGYLKVLDLWSSENSQAGVANAGLNIASIYRAQGNLKVAEEYGSRSLSIYESFKNKQGTGAAANIMANIMLDKGDLRSAEEYANKSIKSARELGIPKMLMSVASVLKKIYEKQQNYKGALEMQELSVKMRDSVENENTRKTSIKKQFQIEYERRVEKDSILNATDKRNELVRHEQAISEQRIYTAGGISGFLLMLVVSGVAYRAYKNKKKVNAIITEQNTKIEMANKDLKRQHLLNQKIFSVISHDFRGPILSLHLVLNKFNDHSTNEKLNSYLRDIGSSVHNASSVLNNLLNWAKTEIALESLDSGGCRVEEIVRKTELEFSEKLAEKKLRLLVDIPEDAMLMIPHDILQIAVRNLVSNAIKFSYRENNIDVVYDRQKASLTVRDYGTGITPEKQAQLFSSQTNPTIGTGREEGFGIGLYIVSELLYKYGFEIRVNSEPDQGTAFEILRQDKSRIAAENKTMSLAS